MASLRRSNVNKTRIRPLHGVVVALLLLAVSCGGASSGSGQSPIPTASRSIAPAPINVFSSEPSDGTRFVAQGTAGVICAEWVVLATGRVAYSPDEIQQIVNLPSNVFGGGAIPTPLLKKEAAVLTDPNISSFVSHECHVQMQITNVSSGSIQIPKVGWRFASPPRPNSEQYRLVDLCPQNADWCGLGGGAGPRGCDYYWSTVTLSDGAAGADFVVAPVGFDQNRNPCPPITLAAGQSIEFGLFATSSSPLIYSAEPVFYIEESGNVTAWTVSDLASNMPFADASQFGCYRIQGTSLVLAWSGRDAVDNYGQPANNAWCI